jgi:hypothetical protein
VQAQRQARGPRARLPRSRRLRKPMPAAATIAQSSSFEHSPSLVLPSVLDDSAQRVNGAAAGTGAASPRPSTQGTPRRQGRGRARFPASVAGLRPKVRRFDTAILRVVWDDSEQVLRLDSAANREHFCEQIQMHFYEHLRVVSSGSALVILGWCRFDTALSIPLFEPKLAPRRSKRPLRALRKR